MSNIPDPSTPPEEANVVNFNARKPRPSQSEMLARADCALGNLREGFVDEARCQLALLQAALAGAEAADAVNDSAAHDRRFVDAYNAAHEIRGQAGSFDYGLLTIICGSLCDLIELHQQDRSRLDLVPSIRLHVSMVSEVLNRQLTGDGGAFGDALAGQVANLNRLIQSSLQPIS